jgi:hypothetical protein
MLEPSDQLKIEKFLEYEAIEDIDMLIADFKKMKKTLSNISKDIKDIQQEGIIE